MSIDHIYPFCLSDSKPFLQEEEEFSGLQLIETGGFYVVVKYVSSDEFSSESFKMNLSDNASAENNSSRHLTVNNTLMKHQTILPFKFGTIFHSGESLGRFIADCKGSLTENLSFIRGLEEWAVKIYCNRKTLSVLIDELSDESAALEEQIMASSPGKAFLLRRKKSGLIENELDRICKVYGQEYYNELRNMSKETCLNNLLPKELTGREENMILNASFLISKDDNLMFGNTIEKLRERHESSGFIFEVSGPRTPYSFIHL